MRTLRPLLLVLLALLPFVAEGKKAVPVEAVEPLGLGQQRFRYYFYAMENELDQEHYAKGMALLLFLHQMDSTDAATNQNLGSLWRALGQNEPSLKYYGKAYEGDPHSYWSHYSALLFQQGRHKEALQILQEAVKSDPENIDAWESLSSVYEATGQYKKAIQIEERLATVEGLSPYYVMNLYKLYGEKGDYKKAVGVVERYLQENPEDYRFQAFLGDIYLSLNEEEKALQIYAEEQTRHPDNPYLHLSLADYYAQHKAFDKSQAHILDALTSGVWDCQQKLQIIRKNQDKLSQQAGLTEQLLVQLSQAYPMEEAVWQALGDYYLTQKQYLPAQDAWRRVTDLNPSNTQAWEKRLQVLQADSTSANALYEEVINGGLSNNPEARIWYYWKAQDYLVNLKPDSALAVLEQGLYHTPEPKDLTYTMGMWVLLGDLKCTQEQYDQAFEAYEQALLLNPKNAYVLNNYAYTLALYGNDLKKAEKMSQETIQQEPANPTYLDTYAWILHLQGQDALAAFYMRKAKENMGDKIDPALEEHYQLLVETQNK